MSAVSCCHRYFCVHHFPGVELGRNDPRFHANGTAYFEVAQQLGYAPAHRHGKGETRRGASRLKMGIAQMAAVLSIFCMVVYKRGYRLTDEFYHHVPAVLRGEESRAAGE